MLRFKVLAGLIVVFLLIAIALPAAAGDKRYRHNPWRDMAIFGMGIIVGGFQPSYGYGAPMTPAGFGGYHDYYHHNYGYNGYNNYNSDFERGYRDARQQRQQERENAAYQCGRHGRRDCGPFYSVGEYQAYQRGLDDLRNEMAQRERQRQYELGRQRGNQGGGYYNWGR